MGWSVLSSVRTGLWLQSLCQTLGIQPQGLKDLALAFRPATPSCAALGLISSIVSEVLGSCEFTIGSQVLESGLKSLPPEGAWDPTLQLLNIKPLQDLRSVRP